MPRTRRTLDQVVVSDRDYRYLTKKRTGRAALGSVRLGGEILAMAALYDIQRERRDVARAAGAPVAPEHYRGRHRKPSRLAQR